MWASMAIPREPNQRCPLDFVSDALACTRRFHMLNVINDYSRECLALAAVRRVIGAWQTDYTPYVRTAALAGWHPRSLRTAPAKCIWKPKISYQRPENREQVIARLVSRNMDRHSAIVLIALIFVSLL